MADKKISITIEVDGVKQIVNNVEEAEKAMKGLGKETKKVAQENKFLGDAKQKWADFKSGIKGATTGFKGLKGAIAATGIGLLLIAITSLISYFKNTEEGSRKLAIATEALGIIFGKLQDAAAKVGEMLVWVFTNPKEALMNFVNLIKNNIINRFEGLLELLPALGNAISELFKGNFSSAGKIAADAMGKVVLGVEDITDKVTEAATAVVEFATEVVVEVKKAVAVATKLVDQFRAIRDAQQELIVANANLNKELETQQKIAEDTTRTYEERKEALEKVGVAQVKLAENLARIARLEEQNLKLQISQEGNYEKREELETSLAEATAARIDAETALETRKIDVLKITAELELEEVARKQAIMDMIAELDIESIDNTFRKAEAELRIQEEAQLRELETLKATEDQKQKIRDGFTKKRNKLAKEEKKFNEKVKKEEMKGQIAMAGQTFGAIAGLLGENSAAGKAAAIAAATINTYQGITAELATKTITPFEIGLKIANVATIAAIGFKSVKDIISTPVPGGGGGGGGAPSMSIPSATVVDPSVALAAGAGADGDEETTVQLGQQTGSSGANVVRAYVVSDEMTTQQEADAKINDLARL
tara:strand:+ start:3042 stop:4826 length:1785 start_codon:yes stop_codon:yes gene_type:complete